MKTCTKCKIEKLFSEFSKRSASKDLLNYHCKECRRRHANEKSKESSARMRDYYRENIEKILDKTREYRKANASKISEDNRAYKKANPEKRAAHGRNYRARLRGSEGGHTESDITVVLEGQQGLCANCQTKLFKSGAKKYHVDHIMPLALGGSNWPSNLQCLCPSCNLRKHAKDPISWAQENGRLL